MKKFILMPLLFFKISTCMRLPKFDLQSIFGTTSSNNQSERLRSLRLKESDFRIVPKPKQKITTNQNLPIWSFSNGFKEIMPPRIKYVTQLDMLQEIHKAKNAQQNEITKIRIQDAIISVALFTLSKIDYSWIFQTVKNFFKPNTQTYEK